MSHQILSKEAAERLEELLVKGSADILQPVVDLLQQEVGHYDWVGFYLVDPTRSQRLVLGPFAGEPTDHTCIEFGQGICGQAAQTGTTFVVDDVNAADNYLACSLRVKSEIVIPVYHEAVLIGELDLDSWLAAAFTAADRSFLEELARRLAPALAESRQHSE